MFSRLLKTTIILLFFSFTLLLFNPSNTQGVGAPPGGGQGPEGPGQPPDERPIPPPKLPDTPELTDKGFTKENLIGKLVSDILPIVFGLAGFLTAILIVVSGIQFITSSGNPEATAGARNRLIFAIFGFIIIILAFSLTQIVDKIFLGGSGIL